MSLNALEMKDVSFSYDHQMILEDINFTIEEKDFVAIIGPNGGGKSTLLKIALGLLTPDKGEVKIFGKEPKKALDMVGYLPQHSLFDPDFPIDVFQTVLMGRYHGLFKDYNEEDKEIALQALKDADMLDFKDRQISRLSGGQLQRVLVARALAREPKIFLMDEPMASIDPEMQNSFYELISRLKGKVALVLVSHDVGTVSMHMDKIACLNQKLYYHGPTEGAGDGLEEMYHYSIKQISHGIPHRMSKKY